ncbi:MAG: hypothetical protein HUN04_02745 [Desulfobacter sp.]|nr:MAG: hypothetical protein HUN04_02745 [Desulfobacter sp.]
MGPEEQFIKYYNLRQKIDSLQESNIRQQKVLATLEQKNHKEFIDILSHDVEEIRRDYNKCPTQGKRRNFIRAVFVFIEGIIFIIKDEILTNEKLKREKVFTPEEIMLLKEESPSVSRGKARKSTKYLKLAENIRFTIKCFSKANHITNVPNLGGQEWEYLIDSINIRHRVTHPKKASDLEISENDLAKVVIGHFYFKKITTDLFEEKAINLKKLVRGETLY